MSSIEGKETFAKPKSHLRKVKTLVMTPKTKKKNLRIALKRLPKSLPSKAGPFGELPPKKRLKDFFETVLNVGEKPGAGFTICTICFKYVAIRKYMCEYCKSKNPSSRNPRGGTSCSKEGS